MGTDAQQREKNWNKTIFIDFICVNNENRVLIITSVCIHSI